MAKSDTVTNTETVAETTADVEVATQTAPPSDGGINISTTEFVIPGMAMGFLTSECDFTGTTHKAAVTIIGKFQTKTFKRDNKDVQVMYFQSDCTGGNEEVIKSFIQQINPNHAFDFRSTSLKGRGTFRGETATLEISEEKSLIAVMDSANQSDLRFPEDGEKIFLTVIIEVKEGGKSKPVYLKYWAPVDEHEGTFYQAVDLAQTKLAGLTTEHNLLPAA